MASMLLSLATGRQDLLGQIVWAGAKRVWYWNLEDDLAELEMQLVAAAMYHGVGQEACGDRLFLDSGPEGNGLCIALDTQEGTIIEPVVEALVAELIRRKIDVLVVDPFVSSHGVSENDNGAIDRVVKAWGRIAKRAGCSVVLVHHTKKLGGDKVTAEASRGASSLVSAARVTLVLNRMDKDEAKHFGIAKDRERKRLFTVQDDKANRAPAEDAEWFRLASQDVENSTGPDDPYGNEGDSVGVVTRWIPPDPFEGISTDHLLRVQRQIADGSWKESVLAKDWAGLAVANALGLDAGKGADNDRARISQLLRTWIANGALVVVSRRDPVKRENKPYVEVGQWADQAAAPVRRTGAGQAGASGASEAPRPSCPPMGQRGGAGNADEESELGRYPAGNPALRPILAPGETGREPISGYEDYE
ncbi:hypothetical protein ASE75_13675 [Sphingomonas sp. Leaf17]|nr:hypothetical protein ASE75_13675 [Sphingomonas sp. Leaf17]